MDAMVAMNERFAHLLTDRPDVPLPAAFPTSDGGGDRWEETLGHYSDRTRRVLKRLHEIEGGEPYVMAGNDLLHTDYSLGNVLFDDNGQISGIVDWNFGADRGDRRYALLAIRANLVNEGAWYSRDSGCSRSTGRGTHQHDRSGTAAHLPCAPGGTQPPRIHPALPTQTRPDRARSPCR